MFSGGKVMTKSKEVKFEMLLIAIMLLLFLRINHSAGKASLKKLFFLRKNIEIIFYFFIYWVKKIISYKIHPFSYILKYV